MARRCTRFIFPLLGQDVIGHSEEFIHKYFVIGMCVLDIVSLMHWLILTVEVHYQIKRINPSNSVAHHIKTLILLVAWFSSACIAGVFIFMMKIHQLVGIVCFFTLFMALFLILYYATVLRRNLRRRNKVYYIQERSEAPMANYKFDYIPTQYIANYFVFVSPWIGAGMYEAISSKNHLPEQTSAILLLFYSIFMITHPMIYGFRKCVSLH